MGSARMLPIMHVKHLFVSRAEAQQKQMRRLTTAILHIVPQSGWRFLPVKFDQKTKRDNADKYGSCCVHCDGQTEKLQVSSSEPR